MGPDVREFVTVALPVIVLSLVVLFVVLSILGVGSGDIVVHQVDTGARFVQCIELVDVGLSCDWAGAVTIRIGAGS